MILLLSYLLCCYDVAALSDVPCAPCLQRRSCPSCKVSSIDTHLLPQLPRGIRNLVPVVRSEATGLPSGFVDLMLSMLSKGVT